MSRERHCAICKRDLTARVNEAGGSKRRRFPPHTRVTLAVSDGVRTRYANVMLCAEHGIALQDACLSAGVPRPSGGERRHQMEWVMNTIAESPRGQEQK